MSRTSRSEKQAVKQSARAAAQAKVAAARDWIPKTLAEAVMAAAAMRQCSDQAASALPCIQLQRPEDEADDHTELVTPGRS